MKKIIVLLSVVALAFNANAQLGKLKKLKNKVESTKTDPESSSTSSGSVISTKSSELEQELKGMMFKINAFKNDVDLNSSTWMLKYSRLEAAKETFASIKNPNAEIVAYMDSINDYFDNYIPNEFAAMKQKQITEIWLKYAFDENEWKVNPERGIKQIDYELKGFLEEYYEKSKDSVWINELTELLKKQKAMLLEYKDGGEFTANKNAAHEKKIAKVIPNESGMEDASVNSTVKKYHNLESGEIQKIIITSSDWLIEKNSGGLPLSKYVHVEVITIIDGSCYLNRGKVYRDYEGGGKYGNKKLSFYFAVYEMSCSNY